MEKNMFYKLRICNNHWMVAFLDEETDEHTIISDDILKLQAFFDEKKDYLFIGANNHSTDDIYLTSLIKNHDLSCEVNEEDVTYCLPTTLDITEGMVSGNFVDFHNMISTLWNDKDHAFLYHYALVEEDVLKQLLGDLELVKQFYQVDERKRFLQWKVDLIQKYHLPKEAYHYSFKELMDAIIEVNVDEESDKEIKLDFNQKLEKLIVDKNDSYLNELFHTLKDYYSNNDHTDKFRIQIDDCIVQFNGRGILGSMQEDLVDTDDNSEYSYLYIDFNSFGPSILINNHWLDTVSKHPERYTEIRDLRLSLKAQKQLEQLFYKYILNAGLECLNHAYTNNGEHVGASLAFNGVMTMMLLYRNIQVYGTRLIECNTDGILVQCPKNMVENIKKEVQKIEEELSLSCDVDVVDKIVHFDTRNYYIQYADGSEKHLGVFGAHQTHPFYCNGISAVDLALREYYMRGIPVSKTLHRLRNENNLEAFQIVKKQNKREKEKYIKTENGYILYNRPSSRFYAVREDALTNPFYISNHKGVYEEYTIKRGKRVQDGFYHFQLADQELPSIHDIDMNYYMDACYKIIQNHPVSKTVQIQKSLPQRNCFIDLDGTLIHDKDALSAYQIFYKAVDGLISDEEVGVAYELFSSSGGYLLQFLGLCKKFKGYGTIDHFAEFLKSKDLFPGKNIQDYQEFVKRFCTYDREYAKNLDAFPDAKDLLEFLKDEKYYTILYSNWFKNVQEAKLDVHGFMPYFSDICCIDDYYAKSSVKGWEDLLESKKIDSDSFNVMIGNGSSDLVPKRIQIPSIIVNHLGKPSASKVLSDGIVIHDFSEFINPNFYSELCKVKSFGKRFL